MKDSLKGRRPTGELEMIEASASLRVAIVDSPRGRYLDKPDVEQEVFSSSATATLYRVESEAELIRSVTDADAIITWHDIPWTERVIARLLHCRGIVCASVGYDHVDLDFAATRGIPVCNVPDYCTEEVADHTLGLILALVRNLRNVDAHVREGGWDWQVIGSVPRLRGMTLGIIGFGRIGRAVAKRASAFGLKVTFYDPWVPNGTDKSDGVNRSESLDELVKRNQIISLHVPLSSETRRFIGRKQFELMNSNTVLINTSRGQVIDEEALIEFLAAGRIGWVGLDVLSTEPNVAPFLRASNRVLLTAHSAFYSDASLPERRVKSAQIALRLLLGQRERNLLNGVPGVATQEMRGT